MQEIKAPDSFLNLKTTIPKVFLAGSIEMGLAEKWQLKLVNLFIDFNVIFLNPRRDDWDSSWEQSINNPQFLEQVEWELNGLEYSDIIVYYFSPNTQSPITLLELGLFANTDKQIIVCCPDGFYRKGNIEILCKKYNKILVHSFHKLADELYKLIYLQHTIYSKGK